MPMPRSRLAPIFALLLLAALVACGRRATEADCQLIVERSVELQAKEKNKNPDEIAKEKEIIRGALQDKMMKKCVGNWGMTDKMMTCVQNARTSDALDRCMQ
jgi:small lipoprotein (TIGR04454 family)